MKKTYLVIISHFIFHCEHYNFKQCFIWCTQISCDLVDMISNSNYATNKLNLINSIHFSSSFNIAINISALKEVTACYNLFQKLIFLLISNHIQVFGKTGKKTFHVMIKNVNILSSGRLCEWICQIQ